MRNNPNKWEKLGRILTPDPKIDWLYSHTGAATALPLGNHKYQLFLTGRDQHNRSRIGKAVLDISKDPKITFLDPTPVLPLGEPGAFDESGTSYPCTVQSGEDLYLYYTGWKKNDTTPFINNLGLAKLKGATFDRVSHIPVLEKTETDPAGIGSVFVRKESTKWHMWYTAFTRWDMTGEKPKHYYKIKYAHSRDGIHWERNNSTCIDFHDAKEYAICRPSVIYVNGIYHMYFCARGDQYRLGYAYSEDGLSWTRDDTLVGLTTSSSGWDSEEICYPYVFLDDDYLYMQKFVGLG